MPQAREVKFGDRTPAVGCSNDNFVAMREQRIALRTLSTIGYQLVGVMGDIWPPIRLGYPPRDYFEYTHGICADALFRAFQSADVCSHRSLPRGFRKVGYQLPSRFDYISCK